MTDLERNLQARLDKAVLVFKEKEAEITNLKTHITELKNQQSWQDEDMDNLKNENEKLAETIKTLRADNATLIDKLDSIAEPEDTEQIIGILRIELEEKCEKIDELTNTIKTLRDKIDFLEPIVKRYNEEKVAENSKKIKEIEATIERKKYNIPVGDAKNSQHSSNIFAPVKAAFTV